MGYVGQMGLDFQGRYLKCSGQMWANSLAEPHQGVIWPRVNPVWQMGESTTSQRVFYFPMGYAGQFRLDFRGRYLNCSGQILPVD